MAAAPLEMRGPIADALRRHRREQARLRREGIAGLGLLAGLALLFGTAPGGGPYLPGDLLAVALLAGSLYQLRPVARKRRKGRSGGVRRCGR